MPARPWRTAVAKQVIFVMAMRRPQFLALLAAALFAAALPCGQPPRAAAAGDKALTPQQAQQALTVLQDPKKRDELIDTLRTIAKAAPPAPAQVSLEPGSLGAQLLAELTQATGRVSGEIADSARAAAYIPRLWHGLGESLRDPAARSAMLAAAAEMLVILAAAFAAEWATRRAVTRPRARMPRPAAAEGGEAARDRRIGGTWRLLRRLPFAAARLFLDLLPVAAFLAVGTLLPATIVAAPTTTRLVIFAVVNAYALSRATVVTARMLVAPFDGQHRLLHVGDAGARYIDAWILRITIVAVFGSTLAEAALLLGLSPPAYQALVKLVALVVQLFLATIVLQCRRGVAARIRAPEGTPGSLAALRSWFAGIWHYVAVFYLVAFWAVWAIGAAGGLAGLVHFFVLPALVLIAGRLVSIIVLGTLDRAFHRTGDAAARPSRLERRLRRYHPLLRRVLSAVIVAATGLALAQAWGLDAFAPFRSGRIGERLLGAAITIAIAAAAAAIVWEAVDAAVERHLSRLDREARGERSARLKSLLPMLRTCLFAALLTILALTALSEIGVDIAPLLAGAGIIGIALGFGSQKLVQDVVTGVFLLFENAIRVGDAITVSGLSGTVERLSIRNIWLRAGDGALNIIPFSAVTTISNTSRGLGNAAVSLTVAYNEDIDRVTAMLKRIAAELRRDPHFAPLIHRDLELSGIDQVSASGVTIIGHIECTDEGRWPIQREFNRRLLKHAKADGIELAAA
jgi:moderate conductance mechanosensitive channel